MLTFPLLSNNEARLDIHGFTVSSVYLQNALCISEVTEFWPWVYCTVRYGNKTYTFFLPFQYAQRAWWIQSQYMEGRKNMEGRENKLKFPVKAKHLPSCTKHTRGTQPSSPAKMLMQPANLPSPRVTRGPGTASLTTESFTIPLYARQSLHFLIILILGSHSLSNTRDLHTRPKVCKISKGFTFSWWTW